MLEITIPGNECYNEATQEFITTKPHTLQLEHSLVSISKWEAKWHKPFLGKGEKTSEEAIDYIRCMTINKGVDPVVYNAIPKSEIERINAYLSDSMTATWFNEKDPGRRNNEIATSEVIYYWMISLQIPPEYDKWHLNRLMTLIRVCNIKNTPGKKMSKRELLGQQQALNAARRQRLSSHG